MTNPIVILAKAGNPTRKRKWDPRLRGDDSQTGGQVDPCLRGDDTYVEANTAVIPAKAGIPFGSMQKDPKLVYDGFPFVRG